MLSKLSSTTQLLSLTCLKQCWYGGWLLGPEALLGHPQLDGLAPVGGEVLLRRLDQVADEELGVRSQVSLTGLGDHGHQLHHRSLRRTLQYYRVVILSLDKSGQDSGQDEVN